MFWRGCRVCGEPESQPCNQERHYQHEEHLLRQKREREQGQKGEQPARKRRRRPRPQGAMAEAFARAQ